MRQTNQIRTLPQMRLRCAASAITSRLKYQPEMDTKTVLVVDDSGFARRTLRRMLEEGGFRVEEAEGGRGGDGEIRNDEA